MGIRNGPGWLRLSVFILRVLGWLQSRIVISVLLFTHEAMNECPPFAYHSVGCECLRRCP
jgi:hypothetical protein